MKVFVTGDSGPSGFGVATKMLVRQLIEADDFEVTYRTHRWPMSRNGNILDGEMAFPDRRFREYLMRNNYINENYLVDEITGVPESDRGIEELATNQTCDPQNCLVREFGGQEDVWITIGGASFAEQAPDEPYTIVSSDWNLTETPKTWKYYVDMVDEFWVPSEWTKESIREGVGDETAEEVKVMPYGINMNYKPTQYDCKLCPAQHTQGKVASLGQCLRDDSFTFLLTSRMYHIKGFYRTLSAFIREFEPEEDVRFFVKTTANNHHKIDPRASIKQIAAQSGCPIDEIPEIGIRTDPVQTQTMYDLMGQADAFCQISRGECFGIAQLEAAYCGTPVIATNYSAQAEVLDFDNDGFIPVDEYDVAKARPESNAVIYETPNTYPKSAEWAVPEFEAIQERMREVYEADKAERENWGKQARQYVIDNYQWEDHIQPRLDAIKTGGSDE